MKTLIESKIRMAIMAIFVFVCCHLIFHQWIWKADWVVKNESWVWTFQSLEFFVKAVIGVFLFLLACDNARIPEERRRELR